MREIPLGFLVVCLAIGVLGALVVGWVLVCGYRAQLDAQSIASKLAHGKADRDLQRALLCVPQSVHQVVRVELELLGLQQMARWKEQFSEQRRWQIEQDALRLAEWQVLLSGRPQPVPGNTSEAFERQLSDEEIDALPPDLPAPSRLSGRKLPAPKGPVLRNI